MLKLAMHGCFTPLLLMCGMVCFYHGNIHAGIRKVLESLPVCSHMSHTNAFGKKLNFGQRFRTKSIGAVMPLLLLRSCSSLILSVVKQPLFHLC